MESLVESNMMNSRALSRFSGKGSDETDDRIAPSNAMELAEFMKGLCGRAIFVMAAQQTDQLIKANDFTEEDLERIKGAVDRRDAIISACLIKKKFEMHTFYSNYCVKFGETRRKKNRTDDTAILYNVKKMCQKIGDLALSLDEQITKERTIFSETLLYNLDYCNYFKKCSTEIAGYVSSWEQQEVDEDAKYEVETGRLEVRFLTEVCSRLLAVTPITSSSLIEALLTTKQVGNELDDQL